MSSPLTNLLSKLNTVFEQTSSPWYVFGAQAAIIHGAARLTADVDVTVLYGDNPIDHLVQTLAQNGFDIAVEDDAAGFVKRTRVLPVIHLETAIPVDIVFGGPGLEETFVQRAQHYEIEGVNVPVASSEDMICMKILAGREKDLADALAIINAQHEQLDLQYIQSILGMLETSLDRSDLLTVLDDFVNRVN